MKKLNSGQSVLEYFIIMVVVLSAILSCGFIDKIRGGFNAYFTKASDAMTVSR